jgi:hypothetical protein
VNVRALPRTVSDVKNLFLAGWLVRPAWSQEARVRIPCGTRRASFSEILTAARHEGGDCDEGGGPMGAKAVDMAIAAEDPVKAAFGAKALGVL